MGQWYAPEARRSSGRRQARSAQPLCCASFTILLPRPGGAQECGGTVVGRFVCILRLQRCGVCLNPRSRPWVIRSGLPAAARTWDGGGTLLLAHLRRAMSAVYAWSPTPGLRASRLPLAYALLPPSGYKLFGRTRHAPWRVPPPENFVFGVKHSINCFAVFVGCVPASAVDCQRLATPGRRMRRPTFVRWDTGRKHLPSSIFHRSGWTLVT